LRVRLVREAAALEQEHSKPGTGEPASHADARSSRAGDADVCIHDCVRGERSCINQHVRDDFSTDEWSRGRSPKPVVPDYCSPIMAALKQTFAFIVTRLESERPIIFAVT
jgi:hypothetical protein